MRQQRMAEASSTFRQLQGAAPGDLGIISQVGTGLRCPGRAIAGAELSLSTLKQLPAVKHDMKRG